MADNIPGGDIISRWLITTKDAEAALSRGVGLVTGFVAKVNGALLSAADGFTRLGGRMTMISRSFGILSASIFLPLTLGFKDFADKNQLAREKIKELWDELQKVPPFSAAAKQLQQQIQYYANMERSTRSAAVAQGQLSQAFMTLKNTIEQLVVDVIIPYVPRIQQIVKDSIVWIQANRALATTFLGIALKVGAVAAGLAILLKVGGELFKLFGVGLRVIAFFATPIGAVLLALGVLVYYFRGPILKAIEPVLPKLKELWDSFRDGSLTVEKAVAEIKAIIADLFSYITGTDSKTWEFFWDNIYQTAVGTLDKIVRAIDVTKNAITGFQDFINRGAGFLTRNVNAIASTFTPIPSFNVSGPAPVQAAGPNIIINGLADQQFINTLNRLMDRSNERVVRRAFE